MCLCDWEGIPFFVLSSQFVRTQQRINQHRNGTVQEIVKQIRWSGSAKTTEVIRFGSIWRALVITLFMWVENTTILHNTRLFQWWKWTIRYNSHSIFFHISKTSESIGVTWADLFYAFQFFSFLYGIYTTRHTDSHFIHS